MYVLVVVPLSPLTGSGCDATAVPTAAAIASPPPPPAPPMSRDIAIVSASVEVSRGGELDDDGSVMRGRLACGIDGWRLADDIVLGSMPVCTALFDGDGDDAGEGDGTVLLVGAGRRNCSKRRWVTCVNRLRYRGGPGA